MYRVVLIGAGGMARTHAGGYAEIPGASLAGVMDIREEAAKALADDHGAVAYTDFDRMMAELKPDIVDVCVPTPFHAEYVLRAVESRPKGIVVEKPMARTSADCQGMIQACDSSGVRLFVAQVLRFFPEFATAKAKIDSGAIGAPAAVRTKRGGSYPQGWENWYGNIDWSGGVILDLIIHDFDWLRWTFGEVERVFAKGIAAQLEPGARVESDYALVTLRFKSGVVGHVEGTWADPSGFKVAFEVAGDSGLLEYNFNQPAGASFQAAVKRPEGSGPGVAVPESPVAVNPYHAELAHFVDCLESGAEAIVSPRDGLEAVRIAEAAIESARTGRPVIL